jgi:hypothetical protein
MRKGKLTAVFLLLAVCAIVVILLLDIGGQWGKNKKEAILESLAIGAEAKPAQLVSTTVPAVGIEGMQGVAANDRIALYVDKKNAAIAVLDIANGEIWFSNPADREDDPIAKGINKERLSAQMSITYEDNKLQKFTLNSYSDSVKHGQVEFEEIPNGIKVYYTFGKVEAGMDSLPVSMSKERYESLLLAKVDDANARNLSRGYRLSADGTTYNRVDSALSGLVLARVLKAFGEAGYKAEDLAVDNGELVKEAEGKKVFKASIAYTVEGDQLAVRVPTEDIAFPDSFPIVSLSVLDYFGAGNGSDDGYMVVPDGSGSLIHFNNGKLNADAYYGVVYGPNEVKMRTENFNYNEKLRLPVFGIQKNGSALLGMIEQGDAVAAINANIGGKLHAYNHVYPQFEVLAQDAIKLSSSVQPGDFAISASVEIPIYQPEVMRTDFVIHYAFLSGASASYSGMANYYREHLVNNGVLQRLDASDELPFYLELIGAIPKQKSFLGIPYESMSPLTTYDQAIDILEQLDGRDISHIQLRYSGWFNGGVNHTIPTRVKPDNILGGQDGLQRLINYAEQEGVQLYPDVSFIHVYHKKGSFNTKRDAARYLTKKPAVMHPFNPATFQKEISPLSTSYYVLSNGKLPDYVNKFIEAYEPYQIKGLSVRNMGNTLNADFRDNTVLDRTVSQQIVQQQLDVMQDKSLELMITGGNAYALPYASHIIDVPFGDSRYLITDEAIPFYQMVLHGYIQYAGKSVNLSESYDDRTYLLKALETGSNVYFKWTHAPNSAVKDTAFNHLYSVHYAHWIDRAKSMYAELNAVLADVQHVSIIDHRKLAEQVYQLTYEGGKKVIVNYNDNAVTVQGTTIMGKHFAVVGENL